MESLQRKGKNLVRKENIPPSLLEKSNELKSLDNKIKEKELEYAKTPQPRTGKTPEEKIFIKKKREEMRSELKRLKSVFQKAKQDTGDLVFTDDVNKIKNLAASVNYPLKKELNKIDIVEFEKVKQNVYFKALQYFDQQAKLATLGTIKIIECMETFPYGKGCSTNIKENAEQIKNSYNLICIDLAQKNIDPTKFLNPYAMLGVAIGGPVLLTFMANYMKDKPKKKEEVKKI